MESDADFKNRCFLKTITMTSKRGQQRRDNWILYSYRENKVPNKHEKTQFQKQLLFYIRSFKGYCENTIPKCVSSLYHQLSHSVFVARHYQCPFNSRAEHCFAQPNFRCCMTLRGKYKDLPAMAIPPCCFQTCGSKKKIWVHYKRLCFISLFTKSWLLQLTQRRSVNLSLHVEVRPLNISCFGTGNT